VWDQRDIILAIDNEPRLLRPGNFPKGTPGKGHYIHQLQDGRKILVANFMGRLFMDALDDPFAAVNELLDDHKMGSQLNAVFVDFHAETTSEKMAFGHMVDGRVSAVVGTHTHIPTADAHILSAGTAYQTDAGMCGDYDSVIGVRKDIPVARFSRKMPTDRMVPADGDGTVCGMFVETNDNNGHAVNVAPVVMGPHLGNTLPEF